MREEGEKTLYVEVKGETSSKEGTKRFGMPFTGNQIWTHVSVALMKTLVDMSKPENVDIKFGMAFPENHRNMVMRVEKVIKDLKIDVYFVSEHEVSKL